MLLDGSVHLNVNSVILFPLWRSCAQAQLKMINEINWKSFHEPIRFAHTLSHYYSWEVGDASAELQCQCEHTSDRVTMLAFGHGYRRWRHCLWCAKPELLECLRFHHEVQVPSILGLINDWNIALTLHFLWISARQCGVDAKAPSVELMEYVLVVDKPKKAIVAADGWRFSVLRCLAAHWLKSICSFSLCQIDHLKMQTDFSREVYFY